jgi:hypothetical protein
MNSDQVVIKRRTPSLTRWVVSLALAGAIALGGSAMISALLNGSSAKAAFERRTAAEIAQENRAVCARLGFGAGTAAGVACVREIDEVRRLHDERHARDDMF